MSGGRKGPMRASAAPYVQTSLLQKLWSSSPTSGTVQLHLGAAS